MPATSTTRTRPNPRRLDAAMVNSALEDMEVCLLYALVATATRSSIVRFVLRVFKIDKIDRIGTTHGMRKLRVLVD